MRYLLLLPVGLCLALCLPGCVTAGLGSEEAAVLRAKDRVAPALVHIRPVKDVYMRGKREQRVVTGSGFIFSPDGLVATNEHVAGDSRVVRCVLSNKEEVEAEVVGTDKLTDVAVLRLETDMMPLPYVEFGTSKHLEAGQTVLALGSPHGLARSVSKGIVSTPDRYLGGAGDMDAPYNTWIQTDAAINPGNSGGPLVNLRGQVVGINARRLSGADNVGFAIPIDTAKQVVDALLEDGRVQRSWLGLGLQPMTSKTDDPGVKGVVIGSVNPLSPAAEAGVRPGDTLLAVGGEPVNARFIEELPAVRRRIAELPVGQEVLLKVERDGAQAEIGVTTEEKSDLEGGQFEFEEWGFTATNVTPAIARRAQLDRRMGVMVSGVQVGGVASQAGLGKGDIVLAFDETPVESMNGFRAAYDEAVALKKERVLLDVKRGPVMRYVLVFQAEAPLPPEEEGLEDGLMNEPDLED